MATQKYCKINGSLVNYSDADVVNLSSSTSAPDQCDFVIQLAYTTTPPIVGQKVQWYTRADVLIWAGVISEVDWSGMYEGSSLLHIPIKAVGFNDRLYHRTTWNRTTFRCAQYRSFTGVVDVAIVPGGEDPDAGLVTYVSGDRFSKDLQGKTIVVNGSNVVVGTVVSPQIMSITTAIGDHSSVAFTHTAYSGEVVKDLLDTYADFEGFTYGSGTSTIQNGAALDSKGVIFDPPVTVMAAIQSILDSNPTFYFATDPNQVAYFGVRTQVAAPADFNNTASPQKRGMLVRTTAEDVRNVEISTTTWDAVVPRSQTITGDSVSRGWFLTYKVAQLVDITLNGVLASSADGTGTSTEEDFFFQVGEAGIWQNPLNPVLSDADSFVVRYKALGDNLIEYADTGASAARAFIEGSGSGRYEQSIDRTMLSGKTAALAEATNSVGRLQTNYQEVTIKTFELGYRVGQIATLTVPKERLSAAVMFIDAVKISDIGCKRTTHDFEYELTCISVARRITDAEVLRSLFGFGAPTVGTSGTKVSDVDTVPPNGLTFTPALYQYGTLTIENIAIATIGSGVRGIYFYVVYVDELTADCYAAAPSVDGTTDPLSITVTPNTGQTSTLAFAVDDWVLWNDAGSYEIGLLTAKVGDAWTIQRHFPGEAGGLSTFEAPMAAHGAVNLFKLQVRRFLLNASETGFNDDPTARFDMLLPAACVVAVTAAPYNNAGLGSWVTYNQSTATVPGLRTLTGGNYTFQKSGVLAAATGTNIGIDKPVQFLEPIRVIFVRVGVAPTGADIKVTPRISTNNGVSWSTLVAQLTIPMTTKTNYTVGSNDPDNRQVPYSGSWPFPILSLGSLLNLAIDQVGSTIAGSDITLEIYT